MLSIDSCNLFEKLVIGRNYLRSTFQPSNRPDDRNVANNSLIYDVFDDQSNFFSDVVIRTDEFVYLVEFTLSLGQIQTTFLHNAVFFVKRLTF